jgi:hypothetical protein
MKNAKTIEEFGVYLGKHLIDNPVDVTKLVDENFWVLIGDDDMEPHEVAQKLAEQNNRQAEIDDLKQDLAAAKINMHSAKASLPQNDGVKSIVAAMLADDLDEESGYTMEDGDPLPECVNDVQVGGDQLWFTGRNSYRLCYTVGMDGFTYGRNRHSCFYHHTH